MNVEDIQGHVDNKFHSWTDNEARAELAYLLAQIDKMQPVVDAAWPPKDIVMKLIEAANILLNEYDYDGHGYELIAHARDEALANINKEV